MWTCACIVCDEFCLPQGRRDAKSEPGYKLENGVVGFPLSFRMLRSRGNAVFAFEDVFREEESHLRWLDETIPLFSFPNSRNLLFPLSFVHFRSLPLNMYSRNWRLNECESIALFAVICQQKAH